MFVHQQIDIEVVILLNCGEVGRAQIRAGNLAANGFDNFKRRVLTALDRSLDRNVPDADPKTVAGEAMWW